MICNVNWEVITGISGSVIALCALVLTIWQAIVARKHNKLTVKPYLTTWSTILAENYFYQVDLINNGVGPALIKSFKVFVDNKELSGTHAGSLDKAFQMLLPSVSYESYNSFLINGYVTAAKDKHELIKIKFSDISAPKFEDVEQAFKRIRLFIEYESIYNEKHLFDSSNYSLLN